MNFKGLSVARNGHRLDTVPLISCQLLNGQPRYAQAFVSEPFQTVSPCLTSISHENTIDVKEMPPSKIF